MKISLKGLSNTELAKLFDRTAKADNKHLAKRKDYQSFNMVAKLWKEKGK